jgi:hypothetical protein
VRAICGVTPRGSSSSASAPASRRSRSSWRCGRPTPELKQARAVNPLVGEGDIDDDPEPPSPAPRYAVQLGPLQEPQDGGIDARACSPGAATARTLSGRALRVGSFSTVARAERLAIRLRKSGYRPFGRRHELKLASAGTRASAGPSGERASPVPSIRPG